MENHDKRQYTAEEKVAILRRHLIEKVTVPDLCDEYHLHPSVFYRWLKQFFETGRRPSCWQDRRPYDELAYQRTLAARRPHQAAPAQSVELQWKTMAGFWKITPSEA